MPTGRGGKIEREALRAPVFGAVFDILWSLGGVTLHAIPSLGSGMSSPLAGHRTLGHQECISYVIDESTACGARNRWLARCILEARGESDEREQVPIGR